MIIDKNVRKEGIPNRRGLRCQHCSDSLGTPHFIQSGLQELRIRWLVYTPVEAAAGGGSVSDSQVCSISYIRPEQ
jgi:hypothetical protein